MFKATICQTTELLKCTNELIAEYTSTSSVSSAFSSGSPPTKARLPNYIRNDAQLLELLFSVFESVFFKKFIPYFILHLHNILNDLTLSYQIMTLISSIIPLISELSKMFNNYFSYFSSLLPTTTSSHYIVVESDHPYNPESVISYLVRFPASVRWISIEFDSKSCTAQDEDYIEV